MGDARAACDEHAHRRLRACRRARRGGDDDAGPLPVAAPQVVVYHAEGCHLCDRARSQLAELRNELGFELREVDITGNDELERAYRELIPVVEVDGRRACVYWVQPDVIRRRVRDRAG